MGREVCYQFFANGGAMFYTEGFGAYASYGQLRQTWGDLGWEWGPAGFPTSNPSCLAGGAVCTQNFTGGLLAWSVEGGGHLVPVPLDGALQRAGGVGGVMGPPTGDLTCAAGGFCYQLFGSAAVVSQDGVGAFAVPGAVRAVWGANGYEGGTLGRPDGDPQCGPDGCLQSFQRDAVEIGRAHV